jgi:hypothetical protein
MSRWACTVARVASATVLLIALGAAPVFAHHILGIPHYSYDEDYPQTPVLSYRVEAGEYEVTMTGYPGKPEPGERCSLHLYIHHKMTGALLDVPITMTVTRDRAFLDDPIIYGPMEARLDERIYKFHPRFDVEDDYLVRVEFEIEGKPWRIDLPMVVGEPGSPVLVLGLCGGGLAAFLVVVRAARIKRRRRAGARPSARRPGARKVGIEAHT